MAAMLLPERLTDSYGMRHIAPVRFVFHAMLSITRVLVRLLNINDTKIASQDQGIKVVPCKFSTLICLHHRCSPPSHTQW